MAKDYRSILGVPRDATKEDIRKAYLSRSKVVHPDRFNKDAQPAEWELANEMLRELNEAYEFLKDGSSDYSRDADNNCPPPPDMEAPSRRVFFTDRHILRSRAFMFDALPEQNRGRILESLRSDSVYYLPTREADWRSHVYRLFLALCVLSAASGLYLRQYTTSDSLSFATLAGIVLFYMLWRCTYWIFRAQQRILSDGVYVTHLYFILCSFGEMRFCPVERIISIELERERESGGQRCLDASFKTDGIAFRFCIRGNESQNNLLLSVNASKKMIMENRAAANDQFFHDNDIFMGIHDDSFEHESTFTSKRALRAAAVAAFLTLAILAGPTLLRDALM
jgi:hypothetical protein